MPKLEKKLRRQRFNDVCLARDCYKCVLCGKHWSEVVALEVHHITNRNQMPMGGYVKENGISVCPEHHLALEAGLLSADEVYKLIGSSLQEALDASQRLC